MSNDLNTICIKNGNYQILAGTCNHRHSELSYTRSFSNDASSFPIQNNVIADVDALVQVYESLIWQLAASNSLNSSPPYCLAISDYSCSSAFTGTRQRELLCELAFEKFCAPFFSLHSPASCVSKSALCNFFLSIDLGYAETRVQYVNEGLPSKTTPPVIVGIGSRHIQEYLKRSLNLQKLASEQQDSQQKLFDVLLQQCALRDFQKDLESCTPRLVKLNSEYAVTVKHELFTAPELLFKPNLLLQEDPLASSSSLYSKNLIQAIAQCYASVTGLPNREKKLLMSRIVLSGGGSKLVHLARRMKQELKTAFPFYVNITTGYLPQKSEWLGLCDIVSHFSTKNNTINRISRQEYFEYGRSVVHDSIVFYEEFKDAQTMCASSTPVAPFIFCKKREKRREASLMCKLVQVRKFYNITVQFT